MNGKMKNEHTDKLFNAILTLKNVEECYDFFEDLCTIAEIKAMAQRFEVAKMLKEQHVYSDIANATGASTATISRVSRCLNYGSEGYRTALERLEQKDG